MTGLAVSSRTPNPLRGWQVDRRTIVNVGTDLQRPECVLAQSDGTLWTADARGGVMRIRPDGSQELLAQRAGPATEWRLSKAY